MHLLKDNYYVPTQFDYAASANIEKKDQLQIEDNTIVYFVDDVFTVKKRVKEMLKMMIRDNLKMRWKCEARGRSFG